MTSSGVLNDETPLGKVSTVFLGLDHRSPFAELSDPSVLWETVIFGGPMNRKMWRYISVEDGKKGHTRQLSRPSWRLALRPTTDKAQSFSRLWLSGTAG